MNKCRLPPEAQTPLQKCVRTRGVTNKCGMYGARPVYNNIYNLFIEKSVGGVVLTPLLMLGLKLENLGGILHRAKFEQTDLFLNPFAYP